MAWVKLGDIDGARYFAVCDHAEATDIDANGRPWRYCPCCSALWDATRYGVDGGSRLTAQRVMRKPLPDFLGIDSFEPFTGYDRSVREDGSHEGPDRRSRPAGRRR